MKTAYLFVPQNLIMFCLREKELINDVFSKYVKKVDDTETSAVCLRPLPIVYSREYVNN